jgi:hypothetical protein
MQTPVNGKEQVNMKSNLSVSRNHLMQAQVSTVQHGVKRGSPSMRIIAAHQYVSPRSRPITPEEAEVRRLAYALKIPTAEACTIAAQALAPLLDSAEAPATHIVLMPVPASTPHAESKSKSLLAANTPSNRHARAVGAAWRPQACPWRNTP